MKVSLTLSFMLFLVISTLGQNNAIVLNNNVFIVLDGGANVNETVLVVNEGKTNGIVSIGTGEVYTTNPVADISFTYNPSVDEIGDGNNITMGDLVAQQYDDALDKCFGWFSGGTANGVYGIDNGAGQVSGVIPPAGDWHRTWTLSDKSSPLPIELTYFKGHCEDEILVLEWQTVSEINNEYFEILKSFDGVNFEVLTTLMGTGNSSSLIDSSYVDQFETSQTAFYSPVSGQIKEDINLLSNEDVEIRLFDNLGREIRILNSYMGSEGFNRFAIEYNELVFGNYIILVTTPTMNATTKLILK
ncbi:MAG: hypothetical protein ACI9N1_000551 [Flavobacteriales bacterium]|jgi:hypothetical protein